jgi:hypothetical protein
MNPNCMRPPPQLYFQPSDIYDVPTPVMTHMYQPVVQVQYSYAPLPVHNAIMAQHMRARLPRGRQSEPQIRWFRTDTGESIEEAPRRSRNDNNSRVGQRQPARAPRQPAVVVDHFLGHLQPSYPLSHPCTAQFFRHGFQQ